MVLLVGLACSHNQIAPAPILETPPVLARMKENNFTETLGNVQYLPIPMLSTTTPVVSTCGMY
jgi:hypothetical protein